MRLRTIRGRVRPSVGPSQIIFEQQQSGFLEEGLQTTAMSDDESYVPSGTCFHFRLRQNESILPWNKIQVTS